MKKLNRSIKIFAAGIASAGIVLVGGTLNTIRLERRTNELESACNASNAKQKAPTSIDSPSPYASLSDDKIIARAKKDGVNPSEWPELFRLRELEQRARRTSSDILVLEGKRPIALADAKSRLAREHKIGANEFLDTSDGPDTQAAPQTSAKPSSAFDLNSAVSAYMNCDLGTLSSESKLTGIQAAIQRAYDAQMASKGWPNWTAAVLLGLGAIPCLWYFLLRRIAELRAAFGGKPPVG